MTMHAVSTFLQNGLSLQLPLRCVGIRPRQATYAPFGRNDFPFFMMTSWLVSVDELLCHIQHLFIELSNYFFHERQY